MFNTTSHSLRLVHAGVAVALVVAAATGIGLAREAGAAGTDQVGTRGTPIAAGESVAFPVWGTNGNCTIPSAATGVATNVTAVNPTQSSYVTVYPADVSRAPVRRTSTSPPAAHRFPTKSPSACRRGRSFRVQQRRFAGRDR